ncbi:MAG TPA: hypothetical protein VH394_13635 [Thermoanaerobaculia bacterium]|jgi:hypothetical protein|nr:hypothetical protein [Thermoanaerobaculia bacterium]
MKWTSFLPLALLLSITPAHAAARKADARTLLGMAQTGLSHALRATQASGGRLDRSRPEQRPFWNALDKMGPALQRVQAGMAARDSSFFRALEDGSADLAELKVVWARTGAPDTTVSGALRVLSSSYELLRTNYGREAVRHRMGFALMPAERERFLRIQRTQERLTQVLRSLEDSARQHGDEVMRAELNRMAEDAWRVASAQLTLNAYLNALMLADEQRGEWTANSQYVDAEDHADWQEAGTVVEELYVEADIGQVFMVDLGDVNEPEAPTQPGGAPSSPGVTTLAPSSSALSHLDEPTEVPEDLSAAVEAYEPSVAISMDGTDDVDPVEEEEALAEEEVVATDETGAEQPTDLTVYEDIEDPEATEEEVSEEPEAAVEESKVEVEDLPIEPALEETAAPKPGAVKPEEKKPEEKKEAAKTEKPAPKPKPAGKTSKKKSTKPPA